MALTVTAVVAGSDRIAGGASVIILGTGFVATPGVTFGGTAATGVAFVSATKLTCTVPAHAAGAVNVVVTNPDTTTATLTNGFTFYTPQASDTQLVASVGGSTALPVWENGFSASRGPQSRTTFVLETDAIPPRSAVRVGLGSLADADLIFRGRITSAAQTRQGTLLTYCHVDAEDMAAEFNRHLAWGSYVGVAADVVALDLLSKYAPDFTGAHIVSGLAAITITFTGELMTEAFARISALIGGYDYRDDSYDVHLFITESPALTPDALDVSNTTALDDPPVVFTADTSQLRNRVIGIGASAQTLLPVTAGDTSLVVASDIFPSSGTVADVVGGQLITYSGKSTYRPAALTFSAQTVPQGEWLSVCWSPALGLFAAIALVGGGTTTQYIATSPDGQSWTMRTAPDSTFQLQSAGICWSATLGMFVAVGGNSAINTGWIVTSPDGITWTSRTSPATTGWYDVCWSAPQGKFVAVGDEAGNSSQNDLMTSTDGVTWTGQKLPSAGAGTRIEGVIWVDELALFIAAWNNPAGTNKGFYTSPDGTTWTQRGATPSDGGVKLAWSPTLGLAVCIGGSGFTHSNDVYTSPDGLTWTLHSSVLPSAAFLYLTIVWLPNVGFLAAGGNATLALSTDGVTWTQMSGSSGAAWKGSCYSPELNIVVLVGGSAIASPIAAIAPVLAYSKLTGIPASGAGSIAVDIVQGGPISLYSARNDLGSQALIRAIEGGTSDGVYEFKIEDSSLASQTALDARCDADLEQYASAAGILSIEYPTRDRNSGYGKPLHVNLPWAPLYYDPDSYDSAGYYTTSGTSTTFLTGDFVIDDVELTVTGLLPLYRCTARSKRLSFSVADILKHAVVAA